MEDISINRVELQGKVGTVRISPVAGTLVANFSLMTEHHCGSRDGSPVCEVTWHNVAAFQGEDIRLDGLDRNAVVNVKGRLRQSRYTACDGTERIFTEIIASSLTVIKN